MTFGNVRLLQNALNIGFYSSFAFLLLKYNCIKDDVFIDDGYSGLNFERPNFQRMIDDIVLGKIHTVVTKDLSRLAVGQYTEIYFPTHKVRYIAVTDGVDTANAQSTDFAALKNVINEFYECVK